MKSVHCETHDLILKRHADKKVFELKVDNITWHSTTDFPLAIPFVGRSGAGKSTLLEALATMLEPSLGSIRWQFNDEYHEQSFFWEKDKPLSLQEKAILRTRYIGFAFQDTTLTPFLTILDNLIYPQQLLGKSIDDSIQHATELLNKVFSHNINEILSKYPHQLSGGQKQRVSLIQAMCNDPFILFADEPTGSLDEDTRSEVMDVVDDWQKDKGGMFIWVTHHKDDRKNRPQYLYIDNSTDSKINKARIINIRDKLC